MQVLAQVRDARGQDLVNEALHLGTVFFPQADRHLVEQSPVPPFADAQRLFGATPSSLLQQVVRHDLQLRLAAQ